MVYLIITTFASQSWEERGGAHCLGGGGGLIHVRWESWNSNFPGWSVDSPPPPCLLYVQGSTEIKPVLESD